MSAWFQSTAAVGAAVWLAGSAPAEVPLAGRVVAPPPADVPAASPQPPPDAAECGLDDDTVLDFALVDANLTSPTYGETVPRTEDGDTVTVLYVALPSCGHCQVDADRLGALTAAQADAWERVSVRVLAIAAAPESLPELSEGHDLPVLVDTETDGVVDALGGDRWYLYLLDHDARVRHLHYAPDLVGDAERIVGEVDALLAEAPE